MNLFVQPATPARHRPESWCGLGLALALFLALQGVAQLAPAAVARCFAAPAAWLAGSYEGIRPQPAGHDGLPAWELESTVGGPLLVTLACSGFTFFSLAASLAVARRKHEQPAGNPGRTVARALALALALWCLTVSANAVRIVLAGWAHALSLAWLSPHFDAVMHEATGLLVFLSALAAWELWLRRRPRPPQLSPMTQDTP